MIIIKRMAAALAALALMCAAPAARAGASWSQINQPVTRAEGWTRHVETSPFSLGEGQPLPGFEDITVLQWGSYPSIDGSTVCVPMAMELARQLLNLPEEDLNGFVSFSTTHYAYERLISGAPNPGVMLPSRNAMMDDTQPVELFLGTAPSDEELAMAREAGVTLVLRPVCYDAFVFLVNAQNSVNSLTRQQIVDAYTGRAATWDELGGQYAAPIRAYQRPKNSGSQTAMENMVMKGEALQAQINYISDGMSDLVAEIGSYTNGPDALGYSYLYYVTALYQSGDIKVLSVDGVAPTPEAMRSGEYPYTVCYYAVYREGDARAAAMADWMVSEAGQRSIAQAGYIPYTALTD